MLTCRWCGEVYEDNEPMDRTEEGFWCDICDRFTFFDENSAQAATPLLLLEQKQRCHQLMVPTISTGTKLRHQLSPLRYPGGKSKLITYLYSQCPPDGFTTLVEVFAGGASFGLSLLDAGIIDRLILNDIDPGVYALWYTILNEPQELITRIQGPLPNHEDLVAAKEHLSTNDTPCPLLAWSYLLANRLSYSGIIMANPQGGKSGTQQDLLCRWNPSKLIQKINHIHSMRNKIELFSQDCCQFIEEYAWWLPQSCLFIDPPYLEMGPKLYRHSFLREDHERLADIIQRLHMEFPEPFVLITYDDAPFIRAIYPLVTQTPIPRRYSI